MGKVFRKKKGNTFYTYTYLRANNCFSGKKIKHNSKKVTRIAIKLVQTF